MSWEAIGAIGETVGALAVILTLFYVGKQIQHGTASVVASNHEAMISSLRSMRHAIALDAEFADLVIRGETAFDGLSGAEARRFEEFVVSQMEIWEQAYVNYEQGTLDDTIWGGWDDFGREKLTTPGHRSVWNLRRSEFYVKFREYLDREIFESSSDT